MAWILTLIGSEGTPVNLQVSQTRGCRRQAAHHTPGFSAPEIQKRFDDQDAEIARQGKEIAEQRKQLEEQAASDGWNIPGLGEAAATGCAAAVGAVALGQFAMDPTKPLDEMNGALLAGTCTAGAATGGFVYTIGKAAKSIIEDIEDAIK